MATARHEGSCQRDRVETERENRALRREINELCKRPDRKKPEVLFLFGGQRGGKSSLVNTLGKALRGKYYSKAKTGRGNAASKTLTLQWYAHCGVNDCELQDKDMSKCLPMWPNVIDAPGLNDTSSEELREILEMVFGGFIPLGTCFEFLRAKLRSGGVGCLKRSYPSSSEELKVTKVVFVASCREDFPTQMVVCLNDVLRSYDEKTGRQTYDIDVFVVMTHYDLVDEEGRFCTGRRQEKITKEDYLELKHKVATYLSIEGAMKDNSIKWVNYVDGHSKDNPYSKDNPNIDNIALKFMRQIMQPGRSKHKMENKPSPIVTPRMGIDKWPMYVNENMKDYPLAWFFGLLIACTLGSIAWTKICNKK